MNGAIEAFRSAITAAGLTAPDSIAPDGKLRRFATNGKRGDDSGYYVLHSDGVPAGMFGDWRTGVSQTWRADIGRKLSVAEAEGLRRKAEADRRQRDRVEKQRHDEAAATAVKLLESAKPAPEDHQYLVKKDIASHGGKLYRGALVIGGMKCDGALLLRMRDLDGRTWSVQFIAPDGDKRFLPGGRKRGLYYGIVGTSDSGIVICEGFATAASIFEAAGRLRK